MKKANFDDNTQFAEISGVQLELEPLITVVEKDKDLQLNLDLQKFLALTKEITIYDLVKQEPLKSIPVEYEEIIINLKFDSYNLY